MHERRQLMKIIITMAGEGSRFKQAGIELEKFRLNLKDRTMFEFAMESLSAFFDHEFVFVTREGHDASEFVAEKCTALGINDFEIVEISELTSGQATTALAASPHVDDDDAIAIYNIDTYVEEGLSPDVLTGDGCIPVFEAEGEHWSFAAVDENDHVTEVAEKKRISDLASLGLYYFDRWETFESAYEARGDAVEQEYGERYIAPLYNYLIETGNEVHIHRVDADAIHILGTPAEVREFDPKFAERYDLE
jgi:dTDP-glucose pyrophosphorylase